MEAAGIEPASDEEATAEAGDVYVECLSCGAADALHFGANDRQPVTAIDARLARICDSWPTLPEHVRMAVEALCLQPAFCEASKKS